MNYTEAFEKMKSGARIQPARWVENPDLCDCFYFMAEITANIKTTAVTEEGIKEIYINAEDAFCTKLEETFAIFCCMPGASIELCIDTSDFDVVDWVILDK